MEARRDYSRGNERGSLRLSLPDDLTADMWSKIHTYLLPGHPHTMKSRRLSVTNTCTIRGNTKRDYVQLRRSCSASAPGCQIVHAAPRLPKLTQVGTTLIKANLADRPHVCSVDQYEGLCEKLQC